MVFQCLIFVVDRHYYSSLPTSYGFSSSSLITTIIAHIHIYKAVCQAPFSVLYIYYFN